MSENIDVELGPVQETLLIPLLGRARETTKKNGLIRDEKAVEIVEKLDYNFSKWEGGTSLVGATLRTLMYDQWVKRFLEKYPTGTVVELGCGLNTRFERLDNGQATWLDLDLPDAIELRRKFFSDTSRRKMLASSVLDEGWMDEVKKAAQPWIFVSEAVLIYLDESGVKEVMSRLAARFKPMYLLFDTADQDMLNGQAKHDAMRHLSSKSWFRWACEDPKKVELWNIGLQVLESKTFLEAEPSLVDRLPLSFKLMIRYLPFLMRKRASHYKLNLAASEGLPPI